MFFLVQRKRCKISNFYVAIAVASFLLARVDAFCNLGVRSIHKSMVKELNAGVNAAEVDGGNDDSSSFNQLKIAFVTGNDMKAKEMNLILAKHMATKGPNNETSLVDLKVLNVDLPEIQEVSTEAIAKNKAYQAAQLANGPVVVEDTSLQFDALGGMPG